MMTYVSKIGDLIKHDYMYRVHDFHMPSHNTNNYNVFIHIIVLESLTCVHAWPYHTSQVIMELWRDISLVSRSTIYGACQVIN